MAWLVCVQCARIDTKKRASSSTFLFSLTGLRELVRLLCCLSSRFLTHAICTMSINKQGQLLGSQEPPVYSFQVFVQLPLLRTLNVLVACNCFGFIFKGQTPVARCFSFFPDGTTVLPSSFSVIRSSDFRKGDVRYAPVFFNHDSSPYPMPISEI